MSEHPLAQVMPRGWLGERIKTLQKSRRFRWNAYKRACRGIPKSSPVAGSLSWKRINERRGELIEHRKGRDEREFRALQHVAEEVVAPGLVIQNFLLSRYLRRLKQKHLPRK